MNSVEKNLRIMLLSIKLQWKKLLQYKLNLVFDLIIRIVDAATFFLFWAVILGASAGIAGWDFKGFLLIFAFESFFISLTVSFAYACLFVYESIHNAELDSYLTKPVNAWLMAALKRTDLSYSGILAGAIALIVAGMQGISLNAVTVAISILMVLLGVAITSLFGLTLGILSFWLGRLESFESIFESFWQFQGKPSNIFPIGLQVLIAFTFPFIFVQTIPAMAVLEKVSMQQMLAYLGIEAFIVVAWFFAFSFLWKKGLRRYESGGG